MWSLCGRWCAYRVTLLNGLPLCVESGQQKEFEDEFVSSNKIHFTLQMIDFFLEMSPYNMVVRLFYFYSKLNKREKSIIDVTTPFELLFTHMLCLIQLCRNQPLNSVLLPTATSIPLYFRKADSPPCPPLTIMFQSITKVKLPFTYLCVWNLAHKSALLE